MKSMSHYLRLLFSEFCVSFCARYKIWPILCRTSSKYPTNNLEIGKEWLMEVFPRNVFNQMLFEDSTIVGNFCIVLTFHWVPHRLNQGSTFRPGCPEPDFTSPCFKHVTDLCHIFDNKFLFDLNRNFYLKLRTSISEI